MKKNLLLILILILIFGVNNVFADSYSGHNINITNGSLQSYTWSFGSHSFFYELNSLVEPTGADYITGNLLIWNDLYTENQTINISTIDWSTTSQSLQCTDTSTWTESNSLDGTIYYQDGSTATIGFQQRNGICSIYTEMGSFSTGTGTAYITGQHGTGLYTLEMDLMKDDSINARCQVDKNGYFICPINKDSTKFNRIRIRVDKGSPSYTFSIGVNGTLYWVTSTELNILSALQSFKNQQQNNASTQHNDSINTQNKIEDINNSITDSNVNGNNSDNTISSIGGTFNTENDFLLGLLTIPYTFWTSITNVFSNSCSPLNVGTMFNEPLIFPCIELNDYLGIVFTTIIDVIFSGIIMSAFVRRIIRYYQALLSLDNSATFIGGVKVW